ncbi:AlbA family DNA-binding domain-containing protein [Streptomyces decoyicus]|uniref:AlbA family DNA-binding domain-containing protein n=1 Tax=Streptomyces decoyicus TaxID=249567 RepID=UPI0033BB97DD
MTAGMLDQAAAIELGESEDLDWKRDADEVKDNREHAKDFAALANANGGLIITGVAEDGNGGLAGFLGFQRELPGSGDRDVLAREGRNLGVHLDESVLRQYAEGLGMDGVAVAGQDPHAPVPACVTACAALGDLAESRVLGGGQLWEWCELGVRLQVPGDSGSDVLAAGRAQRERVGGVGKACGEERCGLDVTCRAYGDIVSRLAVGESGSF